MKKMVLIIGLIILAYIGYSFDTSLQQQCNMKENVTQVDDCKILSKSDKTWKCCYQFMRILTLNIKVCKYMENTEESLDAEFDLLRNTYSAKNVSIDCSSETLFVSSSIFFAFIILF